MNNNLYKTYSNNGILCLCAQCNCCCRCYFAMGRCLGRTWWRTSFHSGSQ